MATTDFVSGTTITADWLNDVDAAIYDGQFPQGLTIDATALGGDGLTIIQADEAASVLGLKYSTDNNRLANIGLYKIASDTVDSFTAVENAEILGGIYFGGSDGTELITSSTIFGAVDGTVSTGVVPGLVRIRTASSAGTMTNRMVVDSAGQVLIGTANPTDGRSFTISKTMVGSTSAYGSYNAGIIQADVTAAAYYYSSLSDIEAAATCTNVYHYHAAQGTFGAGSTVTTQYGFAVASSLASATNNYGFHSSIAADGTNDYNFYAAGTAPNYFAGQTTFGSVMGYASTAGDAVTQNTNKSTGVTINKPTGKITLNAASLNAATTVSFVVNNSLVTADDVIIANIRSVGTVGAYTLTVSAVAAGSFTLSLRNETGGALSEAVVINFAVIKGDS